MSGQEYLPTPFATHPPNMELPLLTPTTTRGFLDGLNVRPRKNLGQNFLVEPNLVRKSLRMAQVGEGETVVEIGPGLGTLTRGLLNAGAEVHAVEQDPAMVRHLEADLVPRRGNQLLLLEGDALKQPRANLPAGKAVKVVANLPYAITTPWLETILADPLPTRMVLLMQKEAAQRVMADPGTKAFGPISIFVQSAFQLADQHRVSPRCFHPVPEVDSALIRLDLRPDAYLFTQEQRTIIRSIFTRRRKQLKPMCAKHGLLEWFTNIAARELPETVRPEQVPAQLWQQIG